MHEFKIGDIVEGRDLADKVVKGPIVWKQANSERLLVNGCGTLFLPTDLIYLNAFINDFEGYQGQNRN